MKASPSMVVVPSGTSMCPRVGSIEHAAWTPGSSSMSSSVVHTLRPACLHLRQQQRAAAAAAAGIRATASSSSHSSGRSGGSTFGRDVLRRDSVNCVAAASCGSKQPPCRQPQQQLSSRMPPAAGPHRAGPLPQLCGRRKTWPFSSAFLCALRAWTRRLGRCERTKIFRFLLFQALTMATRPARACYVCVASPCSLPRATCTPYGRLYRISGRSTQTFSPGSCDAVSPWRALRISSLFLRAEAFLKYTRR